MHTDASLKLHDANLSMVFESVNKSNNVDAFAGKFAFHTTPIANDGFMHIVTVLREDRNLVLRVSEIGGTDRCKVVYEVRIPSLQLKESTRNNFVFQHEPARLVAFGMDGILKVFHLESGKLKPSIQFSVASLGYRTEYNTTEMLGHSITICDIDSTYISVLGSNSSYETDIVSIWDTKFGTLQCHKSLRRKDSRGATKVYGLDVSSSSANGPIPLVTTTTIPREKSRALAFKNLNPAPSILLPASYHDVGTGKSPRHRIQERLIGSWRKA
ncbi:hypothetical protein BJ742DRAFT_110044 [Cladochytrium replicatum]|nr:hypothetical protein BJ742DRAFT_110044 [Cladochytrium replicatum]